MKEQDIQRKIIKYLESIGAYVVKVVASNKSGTPDILACYRGIFLAIEVKRPETKTNVSELQIYNIKKIKEAGGVAIVSWDLDTVKATIEEINSNLMVIGELK
jgi:Holliday junction resolvase|nr:MAG TPA: Nuclease [Caudoviricetes sp.]